MGIMNLPTLLVVAASLTAQANADFTVVSGATVATNSSTKHMNFVKQWTLKSATTGDAITSIDLELAGCVFVSYVSDMPSGILGYVNVSGDTKEIVDAIVVSNDDHNDNDNDDGADSDGELNVRLGNATSTNFSGYALTEIFLASSGSVTDVKSRRSGQIVVLEDVLVSSSTTAELQIESSGSSAVYVSAASTAVSVNQLQLEAAGTAVLQFNVKSVTATDEVQVTAEGSANVSLLSESVKAATIDLEARNTGFICLDATSVTTMDYEGQDASRISMPKASSRYTSTGTFACDESTVPPRELGCVGTTCGNSTTPGGGAGSTPTTTDDDSDDKNAASFPRLATLATAAIGVATATLL